MGKGYVGQTWVNDNAPAINEDNLNNIESGITANNRLDLSIIHNITVDTDYTLTTTQNDYGRIEITDTSPFLSTARNIIMDNNEHTFLAVNSTLQDLTFKTSAGAGIVVAAGESKELRNDTTNVIDFEGAVSQEVILGSDTFTTGTVATGAVQIPLDNTIPQQTEGTQFLTISYTPINAASKLKITVNVLASHSATSHITAALFRDATASAISATGHYAPSTDTITLTFTAYIDATAAASTDFKVRVGANVAGTTTFNGRSAVQVLGGVASSSISIEEIKQ